MFGGREIRCSVACIKVSFMAYKTTLFILNFFFPILFFDIKLLPVYFVPRKC